MYITKLTIRKKQQLSKYSRLAQQLSDLLPRKSKPAYKSVYQRFEELLKSKKQEIFRKMPQMPSLPSIIYYWR